MDCMCRVCETIYGLKNMFDEENEELLLMLRSVANITISSNDLLPKYICEFCSHRLQKTYDFKVQCETTDQKLREIVERLTKSTIAKTTIKIDEDQINENKHEIKKEAEPIPKTQQPTTVKSDTIVVIDSEDEATLEGFPNYDDIVEENVENSMEEDSKEDAIGNNDDDFSEEDEKEKLFEEEMQKLFGETVFKRKKKTDCKIEMDEPETPHLKNEISNNYEIIINGENLDDLIIEDYSEDIAPDEDIEKVQDFGIQADANSQLITKEACSTLVAVEDAPIDKPLNDSIQQNISNDPSESLKLVPKTLICKLFKCPSCPEKFPNKQKLTQHRRKHNRWKNKCNVCQKQFARKSSLNDHMMIHSGRKVTCDICGAQLSNRGNLLRHIQQCHELLKPYQCDLCGMNFARRSSMKIHRYTHSDVRTFACEKCGKTFKTKLYLTIHERRHLPLNERPQQMYGKKRKDPQLYICPHCGKKSKALPTHLTHMKIHNEVKPFECQECPKKFHFKQTLITHMLVHTGERPFKCEICGKAFRQQPHLKTHHRCIHLRAKPYQCKYCLKCFTSSTTLKIHERLHTGERPFKCEVCSQSFIEPKGLKKHKQLNRCKGPPPDVPSEEQEDQVENNDEDISQSQSEDTMDDNSKSNDDQPEESQEELQYFESALGAELEIYLQDIHNDYAEIIEVES